MSRRTGASVNRGHTMLGALRGFGGRLRGFAYLWTGRAPDPDASDDIVADRVRSAIGPLEKHLDVPRVHVTVFDHVATLYGAVPSAREASAIEAAVSRVSGVRGVQSFLHIGLTQASTRPSESRLTHSPSPALVRAVAAVRATGIPEGFEHEAVRVVLSSIVERIPHGEREQLLCHLPPDVRLLAEPPRRSGVSTRIRTVDSLARTITSKSGLGTAKAEAALAAVMAVLKDLVPEESHDVAATLPAELRKFWDAA